MVYSKPARKKTDYDMYVTLQNKLRNKKWRVYETVLFADKIWHRIDIGWLCIIPKGECWEAYVNDVKEWDTHYRLLDIPPWEDNP